jgi:5-formyltetrahydrofolate cyclo-ligase
MPDQPESSNDKAALRRALRRQRAEVPEAMRRLAGQRVARLAFGARFVARGRRIGFYMPAKGELDILPLLNRALWLRVACYLPVVPGRGGKRLWFARLGDGPHWTRNRYDIPEYGARRAKSRAAVLDLIFLPLLGFDMRGYRMGMGGGYYDASLAYLRHRRAWRRPRLVGVGFEAQKCAHIPDDPWDVRLDAVITEARVYRIRPGA